MSKACDHPAVWRILHPDKTAYACEGHLTTLRGPKLAYSKMLEPGTGIACDWKGEGVSERKAEYYAKHLEEQNPNEQMELFQPTGLPTLLARMVNEYHGALKLNGYSGFPDRLVEGFSQMLLACAQPLLAAYLDQLANPPVVVKKQDDEAGLPIMVRAVLAAERQRAEEALALVRAGKGVPAARKHLGLDEEDKQLAYREFCARLTLASPDAPTPSLEEWAAARKRVGLE